MEAVKKIFPFWRDGKKRQSDFYECQTLGIKDVYQQRLLLCQLSL